MLSRLISLLRRIPAVKWAFTRLRSLPHSGSIDVAPIVADEPPAVIADVAPALDTSTDPLHNDADIVVTAPVVESETAISVVAESPTAAPSDTSVSDDSSEEAPTEVGPIEVVESSISSVDVESEPVDVPEVSTDGDPSLSVAIAIEPVPANDPPVAAIAPAEPTSTEPTSALASPAPEIRNATKARARAAEPVDRTTLIRQRWAETGIRMWNPRLHGTGDATLNIQGRVELLPPAPGENLPRYDKLEFKMLGGQIVCEGVIVEAPAQADKRSFTRLAEPGKSDRVREPVRERQAVLA